MEKFIVSGSILIVIAAVLTSFALPRLHQTDPTQAQFESFETLSHSNLFEEGWLPDYFPAATYDIHEKHNIETGEVAVSFNYEPSAISQMPEDCSHKEAKANHKFECQIEERTVIFWFLANGTGQYVDKPLD